MLCAGWVSRNSCRLRPSDGGLELNTPAGGHCRHLGTSGKSQQLALTGSIGHLHTFPLLKVDRQSSSSHILLTLTHCGLAARRESRDGIYAISFL